MSRQPRVSYPGAFYHVYSRGNQKQRIFFSDEDRFIFLKLLRDSHERFSAMWHLYCLMESHYHLGLETPRANLSQIMHFINSAYSIYLNTKHERCGHLFQGRFKAILVQADLYARTLTKYIHANPVRKGFVERPEHYKWSSCQAYFGLGQAPSWLSTKTILACFGGKVQTLRNEQEAYLASPDDLSFRKQINASSKSGIMGDDDFVDKIRRSFLKEAIETKDYELSGIRGLRVRPELSRIRDEVHRELGDKNRLAKKSTIFFAHQYADYKLKEIGEFYGIGSAAASIAFHAIEKVLVSNEILPGAFERIKRRLIREDREPEKGKIKLLKV
jgi:REP-associated tyrosine transposase